MILGLLFAPQTTPLERLLDDPRLSGATVAAIVTDADGNVLFERNSGLHVTPASNMKLFSAAFALHQLGPDWRPHTRIWKERDRTVVESTGDPMLTRDQLVAVRERLRLDRGLPVYVSQPYAPGWPGAWEIGDLPNKYAAPITAFMVDRGAFQAWASGGRVGFRPEPYGTKIVIQREMKPGTLRYDPFSRTLFAAKEGFTKDGSLDTLSLPHPDEAAASLLGSRMATTSEVPSRMPDVDLAGPSTGEILRACLPPSDNQLAENLLLLGARTLGPLGDSPYTSARKGLTDFAQRVVGIEFGDVHVDDGCGLSRHDFVTTRALARLLAWSDRQSTSALWRASLAHPGEGTLGKRLTGVTFAGKTGSMEMVAALSGYVETPNHQKRIVSIVLNGFGCSGADAREIIDRFVVAVD